MLDFEHKLGPFAAAVVTFFPIITLLGLQCLPVALFDCIVHANNKERMMLPFEQGLQGNWIRSDMLDELGWIAWIALSCVSYMICD